MIRKYLPAFYFAAILLIGCGGGDDFVTVGSSGVRIEEPLSPTGDGDSGKKEKPQINVPETPESNLTVSYVFDFDKDLILGDSSGNELHGTTSVITYEDGVGTFRLQSKAEVPHDSRLDITGEYTLDFDFYLKKRQFGHFLGKYEDKVQILNRWSFFITPKDSITEHQLMFYIAGQEKGESIFDCVYALKLPGKVPQQEWIHIKVNVDPSVPEMRMYLNDQAEPVDRVSYDPTCNFTNEGELRIGNAYSALNTSKFEGKLDNIKIYNALR